MTKKIKALAKFLCVDADQITRIGKGRFFCNSLQNDYLVVNEAQRDQLCIDNIEDMLWAFNASFLKQHMHRNVSEKAILKIQELYEDANLTIRAMVGPRLEGLIAQAIGLDGPAHFLNTYDDQEHEQDGYFIYRMS